jgi:hypothetical protein|tara:strand:- start:306 stop:695 length:390 start_codon:yes stop_codon:yes gene_type:complete
MTKLSFKQSDVTGDTRILARSALGYDWNYLADDETLIFGTDSDATITWDGSALNVTGTTTEITDGDLQVLAENLYLGAATAFATTEPTSAIIIKTGTAFAGAIVTSSAIQANDTVLRKIIADGTISNVG